MNNRTNQNIKKNAFIVFKCGFRGYIFFFFLLYDIDIVLPPRQRKKKCYDTFTTLCSFCFSVVMLLVLNLDKLSFSWFL